LKLNNRIKPAVTKVLLCTRELTGVGALIAFGNHPLNGNWALFVKEVKIKREIIIWFKKIEEKKNKLEKINVLKKINKK